MAYEKHEAARLTAGEVGGSVASLTAPDTVVLSLAGCKSIAIYFIVENLNIYCGIIPFGRK